MYLKQLSVHGFKSFSDCGRYCGDFVFTVFGVHADTADVYVCGDYIQ